MKNSPTKFHDLPANLSGSEHAARDGERSRCWEKNSISKARFSYALVLSLCSNLLPFVVCLFETLSLYCAKLLRARLWRQRVLNGLVCKYRNTCSSAKIQKTQKNYKIQKHLRLQCENLCILPITETLAAPMWQFFTVYKHRNTCSNVTICVFCQIQRHLLLQCEIFVYFAVVTNAKVFCDHLNNEVAEFLQMTIALPRVVIYVQYLRKYQSIFFNFVCKDVTKNKNYKSIHPPNK